LKTIDSLVAAGRITDRVVAQIGRSDYEPINFAFHRFLDKAEFEKFISEADMIVAHGGAGTIITALKHKKPVVAFPRLAKYGEHVDDHQREIAHAFAKTGHVLYCGENDDLAERIEFCKKKEFKEYISMTNDIVRIIEQYLNEL